MQTFQSSFPSGTSLKRQEVRELPQGRDRDGKPCVHLRPQRSPWCITRKALSEAQRPLRHRAQGLGPPQPALRMFPDEGMTENTSRGQEAGPLQNGSSDPAALLSSPQTVKVKGDRVCLLCFQPPCLAPGQAPRIPVKCTLKVPVQAVFTSHYAVGQRLSTWASRALWGSTDPFTGVT